MEFGRIFILCCVVIAVFAVILQLFIKMIRKRKHLAEELEELKQSFLDFEHEYVGAFQTLRARTLDMQDASDELMESLKALDDRLATLENAVLPDESAARKAKEQIDAFNAGVFNILSYAGNAGRKQEAAEDEED